MRGWRGSAGMKGLEGRWSLRGGCRGSERARRRQRARECRGAGRAGVANGIQMVGAGVPGAEVRAAHHTQSPPRLGGRLRALWLLSALALRVQSAAALLVRNRY